MTVLEMFEKVNLICPLEQRKFFNYLNDTISEVISHYGDVRKLVIEDEEGNIISSLASKITVLPLYHTAILDNILFLAGQGEHYKAEFIRKSHNAYLKYWNVNAKGRRLKQRQR